MIRTLATILLLASVLLAPTALGVEKVSVPVPTVGSEATYLLTVPVYPNGSQSSEFVLRWEGSPAEVADGFDAVHQAYPVSRSPGCSYWDCETVTWFDVSTRSRVRANTQTLFADDETTTTLGPVELRDRQHASSTQTHYGSWVDLFHALQGRRLAAGDQFTIVAPPDLETGVGQPVTFTALGWETVDGSSLFRVGVDRAIGFDATIWFDGVAAVPARFVEGNTVYRLLAWSAGTGDALADEDYAAPLPVARAGVQRTLVGFDGPSEPLSRHVPLQSATAALHAHPQGALFFSQQPDAYLALAHFQESPELGVVFWSLGYEGATGWLRAQLNAPYLPEGVPAPVVVEQVTGGSVPPLRAPPSDIVGHSFACVEEGLAVIGRADPPEPEAGWARVGAYRVESTWPTPGWDVSCVAGLWPPENRMVFLGEYAVPFDVKGYEAVIHGTTGAISQYVEVHYAYGTQAGLA